jgi:hypothetical protein
VVKAQEEWKFDEIGRTQFLLNLENIQFLETQRKLNNRKPLSTVNFLFAVNRLIPPTTTF